MSNDDKMNWQPIETAPWNAEVLLTGKSGYREPHDRFIINGYRVRDWHHGEWNDATGTHLSERGWGSPTHWMPLLGLPSNAELNGARRASDLSAELGAGG